MIIRSLFRLAAAALLAVSSHAERPSSDQLALEAGVTAWVSAWNPGNQAFNSARLQPLYRADVVTRDAFDTKRSWADYAAGLRTFTAQFAKLAAGSAQGLRIALDGSRATTTFTLSPRLWAKDGREQTGNTQVRLVWEKTDAFWRIAEQEFACSLDSAATPVAANR